MYHGRAISLPTQAISAVGVASSPLPIEFVAGGILHTSGMNGPASCAEATAPLAVLGFIEAKGNVRSTAATRDLTLQWFRQRLGADLPTDAATASRTSAESNSRRFWSATNERGDGAVWACWLEDPTPELSEFSMVIEAAVWSNGDKVERIGFRLLGDTSPDLTGNGLPERLQALCELHAEVTNAQPKFEMVRSEDQVRKLAACLLNRHRREAIIVLSTHRNARAARATELDARRVAVGTSGMASVFVIANDCTRILTDHVGRNLSVFDGAVRVYLPGLRKDQDPQRHELLCTSGTRTPDLLEQEWQRIRLLVAEHSGELYRSQGRHIPYSALETDAVRRRPKVRAVPRALPLERFGAWVGGRLGRGKRTFDRVGRALASIRHGRIGTETESLRSELALAKRDLRASERSRQKLARQLTDERRRTARLTRETSEQKRMLQQETARAEELAGSLARNQLPRVWDEVIGWSKERLEGKLVLHPAILRDLGRAQYEHVTVAARGLLWLAEDYRRSRLDGRGSDLRGALPEVEGLRNERCGSDSFEIDWQGRPYSVDWHLRKGDRREPRHCLRIYYFWDPTLKSVVVADMPEHRH